MAARVLKQARAHLPQFVLHEPAAHRRQRVRYRPRRTREMEDREETFNCLSRHGYNLKRNYGTGKHGLANMLATPNLLAFALHSAVDYLSDLWRQSRAKAGTRHRFFEKLRVLAESVLSCTGAHCWKPCWPASAAGRPDLSQPVCGALTAGHLREPAPAVCLAGSANRPQTTESGQPGPVGYRERLGLLRTGHPWRARTPVVASIP